jgi:hypothetical protein
VLTRQQAVEVGRVWPQVWTGELVGLRHLVTPYAAI